MIQFPQRGSTSRWIAILTGISIFIWLGQEDNHTMPVVLLGLWTAGVIVWIWSMGKFGGKSFSTRQLPFISMMLGAITGLSASILVAALMLFKNARHAHFLPDYPTGMMGATLERAPIWVLAGMFIALSLTFIWMAKHE